MEIAYGPHSAHRLDYYCPASNSINNNQQHALIVFVHGGAWRSEDKADHAALARALLDRTGCAVAVPNYRLTTPDNPIQHPSHSQDVLRSLHFLSTWSGPEPSKPLPPPSRLYLLGHSCSAHILASIFLNSPYDELTPSPELLAATRGIACSEGIYDIDRLLHSFPTYKEWFIAPAFGNKEDFSHANVASYPLRRGGEHIRWLIIHSDADTLVDQLQSQTMYDHLCTLAAGSSSPATRIEKNFDELKEEHNDLLKGEVYPRIIADFVKHDLAEADASAA
ncbi:alpha/beta-hydrolase [Trametes coccinea BRFM310]|uniref:Alpha/beta-hydrolase n=1 Tax=Trametes coccinea (strain BRFM310) TaxID=1353009 RepID=A0A1Y2J7D2_TRAC3|nr:alpha/beta-hydrolase [Trametes coccinea BRFM310]